MRGPPDARARLRWVFQLRSSELGFRLWPWWFLVPSIARTCLSRPTLRAVYCGDDIQLGDALSLPMKEGVAKRATIHAGQRRNDLAAPYVERATVGCFEENQPRSVRLLYRADSHGLAAFQSVETHLRAGRGGVPSRGAVADDPFGDCVPVARRAQHGTELQIPVLRGLGPGHRDSPAGL